MIGPLGRLGAAATLWQHCPQMTQRRCNLSYKFKIASASPISFDSFSAVETSGDALLRAHAVLMILAWMAFVPVAMMMPRYFKGRWDHQVSLALCNRSKLHGLFILFD